MERRKVVPQDDDHGDEPQTVDAVGQLATNRETQGEASRYQQQTLAARMGRLNEETRRRKDQQRR